MDEELLRNWKLDLRLCTEGARLAPWLKVPKDIEPGTSLSRASMIDNDELGELCWCFVFCLFAEGKVTLVSSSIACGIPLTLLPRLTSVCSVFWKPALGFDLVT